MYKKTCPYCNGDSYSAASTERWVCPYCSADLTIFIPLPAGTTTHGRAGRGGGKVNPGFNNYKVSDRVRGKLIQFSAIKDRPGIRNKSRRSPRLPAG